MFKIIKNNKASILPVTVIATFIMMIIAYACIKMFMAQNIMVTQDQIKVRTRYAAEGLAERIKSAIYEQIKDVSNPVMSYNYYHWSIDEEKDVKITAETAFKNTKNFIGIEKLSKNGADFSINFKDLIIPSGVDLDSTFEDKMYPQILSDVSVIESNPVMYYYFGIGRIDEEKYVPVTDTGVTFYKGKGVDVTLDTLYRSTHYNYNNVVFGGYRNVDGNFVLEENVESLKNACMEEINNVVYPFNNADTNDPRVAQFSREQNLVERNNPIWVVPQPGDLGQEFISFYDTTGNVFTEDRLCSVLASNVVTDSTRSAGESVLFARHPTGKEGDRITMRIYLSKYYVLNESLNFCITAKAKSSAVSNKIPQIESTVKIYFGLFMTKLFLLYRAGQGFETYSYKWNSNLQKWTMDFHAYGAEWIGYKFVPDTYKKINTIKLHVQKIQVIS